MNRTCRVVLVTAVAIAAGAFGAANASACILVGFGTSGLGASGAPPGGPVVPGETIGFTLTARDVDGSTGDSTYVVSLNGHQVATGTVSPPGGSGTFPMPDLGPSAQTVLMRAVLIGSDAPPLEGRLEYRPPAPTGATDPSGTPQSPAPSATAGPTGALRQAPRSGSPTPVGGGPAPSSGPRHHGTGAPKTPSPSAQRVRGPVSSATGKAVRPHARARTHALRPPATPAREPVVVSSPVPAASTASPAPAVSAPGVRARGATRVAGRHEQWARTHAVSGRRSAADPGLVPVPDAKPRRMPVTQSASGNDSASPVVIVAVLLLVAAGGSAGGLWLRVRAGGPLTPPPADAVEAELQELIAQESARRLEDAHETIAGAQLVAAGSDRSEGSDTG